mgnify:CR=1 FL=1
MGCLALPQRLEQVDGVTPVARLRLEEQRELGGREVCAGRLDLRGREERAQAVRELVDAIARATQHTRDAHR